jgi:hypothetical protein
VELAENVHQYALDSVTESGVDLVCHPAPIITTNAPAAQACGTTERDSERLTQEGQSYKFGDSNPPVERSAHISVGSLNLRLAFSLL